MSSSAHLSDQCIICLKKVSLKLSDPPPDFRKEVSSPGFLQTFNEIWRVLHGIEGNEGWRWSVSGVISMETVITTVPGPAFSETETPTLCQYCFDKVFAVENLMKAVRQQVREIRMLWEMSKRKRNTTEVVNIKHDDPEILMECDEDWSNSLDDEDAGAADDDPGDGDYIKPEVDDSSNTDDEEELDNGPSQNKKASPTEKLTTTSPKLRKRWKPSSPKKFTCNLESSSCTQSFSEKEALNQHKFQMHRDLMIKLGKLNPSNKFPCSCGRSFAHSETRYAHQVRNQSTHPEFIYHGQLCDFCGELVKRVNILEHLASHLGEGGDEFIVRCPNFKNCGHAFTHSKDMYKSHLNIQKHKNCKKICDEKKFGLKCETCGYTTDQRYKLSSHMANEHERGSLEKKLKCPISGCGKMFAVKQSIFLHLHAHRIRLITSQKCDKCGEDVKIEGMEGHLKEEHGLEEIFGCEHCPLRFSGREEMVEHLWEHRDSGLSCDICGDGEDKKRVKYLKYGEFREHYFVEHQLCPKKYKCGECEGNGGFWRNKELYEHKSRCHSAKEVGLVSKKKRVYCEICNVGFLGGTSVTLISHKIRVHGAEPFRCDICGESFDGKGKWTKHMKEHAGVEIQKEWRCEGVEGCGKIFKSKGQWKMHVEVRHGGKRRHVCEECGKGYSYANGLRVHRNSVHLGLKPWVCEECGERFGECQVLKRHQLIHTGERPFGCDICGQRFRQINVLKTHLKGHEEKGAGFRPSGAMTRIRKRKVQ